MTDKEKRKEINNITNWIACNVFYHKNNHKFAAAYDKLCGVVYLEYEIHIKDRMTKLNKKKATMFDVLDCNELDMVLRSARNLKSMYTKVINKAS